MPVPIYDASSGELIAVKETAPGRKPVRIEIEYEDGGAKGIQDARSLLVRR